MEKIDHLFHPKILHTIMLMKHQICSTLCARAFFYDDGMEREILGLWQILSLSASKLKRVASANNRSYHLELQGLSLSRSCLLWTFAIELGTRQGPRDK